METEKALVEMYELGIEHGRNLALSEVRIKQLEKELEELNNA